MKAQSVSQAGSVPDASIFLGDFSASTRHTARLGHRRMRFTQRDDLLVLGFLDGRLHADLAFEIGEELNAAIAREGITKIVLDFSGVDFACTDVVFKFVVLNKRARERGQRLTLCGVCPHIREIFAITKLDTVLDITDTQTDALLALA
jgi:anti-anti-sigma factor